jgi:hypothetical protein
MDSLSEASPSASDTTSPRLISGGRALTIFLLLIAVVGGILLLTRKDHATAPPPTNHHQTETFALTDSQAIARFKQLDRLRIRAYKERDLSLIPLTFVDGSKIARTVVKEIKSLLRQSILPKPNFRTVDLAVTSNTAKRIEIKQRVLVGGRFITQSGQDVTAPSERQRQTINWILKPVDSDWLISSSLIVRAVRAGGPQ